LGQPRLTMWTFLPGMIRISKYDESVKSRLWSVLSFRA
jgi:hypothetical protein